MQNLVVDSIEYRVRIVFGSLRRSFQIIEGPNSGVAITARQIRDIIGTGYSYTMDVEPNPKYPGDYDAFYNVITAPIDSHRVRMPFGQSELEFDAIVESGEDIMGAKIGGIVRWNGLRVTFKPMSPQKEV